MKIQSKTIMQPYKLINVYSIQEYGIKYIKTINNRDTNSKT